MSAITNVSSAPPYVPTATTKPASKPAAAAAPAPAPVRDNDGDNDNGKLDVKA